MANLSPITRVLQDDNLLTIIFQTFKVTDATDRTTCARAARVCRTWEDPATKTIWRTLPVALNPLPLFHILLPLQNPSKRFIKYSEGELHDYYYDVSELPFRTRALGKTHQ